MEEVSIQSHLCLNISLDIGWPPVSILSLIYMSTVQATVSLGVPSN